MREEGELSHRKVNQDKKIHQCGRNMANMRPGLDGMPWMTS